MPPIIQIESHALLELRVISAEWPATLGEASTDSTVTDLLRLVDQAPMRSDDDIRLAIRDMLRCGGFKPTGRSKPASEYLRKAAEKENLGSINAAVDVGNAVSLHSGVPISVVDLDKTRAPLQVAIAGEGANFIFNRSGQTIDVGGLLCLVDAEGPCANAVKDSQRTKTDAGTKRTLTLIWGAVALPGRAAAVAAWCEELLVRCGAAID